VTQESQPGVTAPGTRIDSRQLLAIVDALVAELHPARAGTLAARLDSALDKELGIDSLARAELALRIERAFGVSLPERAITEAETPADLLRSLAGGVRNVVADVATSGSLAALTASEAAPDSCGTLLAVLDWHAERHPHRRHLTWLPSEGAAVPLTFAELRERVDRVAASLRERGLAAGVTVAIMLPSGLEYFAAFLGVERAGGIPVPLYPPARRSQLEDHLRRQVSILQNAEAELLVTFAEALPFARALVAQAPRLRAVLAIEEVSATPAHEAFPAVVAGDIAFLQYTSGSTGDPKGVVLTHANLIANLRAIGRVLAIGGDDVIVSWLPLYHDMGLIGAWMGSLYYGVPLVLMAPQTFLARPARWLEAIRQYRGTLSAAPNFAYELCVQRISDDALTALGANGLETWRAALNGAEPVAPETLTRFAERFAACGFAASALLPVYGLAESSLAVSFPPPGRGVRFDVVARRDLQLQGRAVPVAAVADDQAPSHGAAAATTLRFVSCGMPMPGHEVRIVDAVGRELGEREQGRLQFRGPSASSGYYRNPRATARLLQPDNWVDSGDLAYIAAGEIYITGRAKDVIIRAGRNIYPQEIEAAVGDLPGVRKSFVAVFASPDPRTGSERLVVMAETREREEAARAALTALIVGITADLAGTPPDEVQLVPAHTIPKTSSGKIRRAASRELYERGSLGTGNGQRGLALRLLLGSAGSSALLVLRRTTGWTYAAYCWTLFVLAAPPVWLGLLLLPQLAWRQRLGKVAARVLLALAGMRLERQASGPVAPRGPCVFAANHQSYLDVFVLFALLPVGAAYVAKRELSARWWSRVPLQRLGTVFVERFDAEKSAVDSRQTVAALAAGQSLVIFPEGTFRRAPGLLPFRMGAFVAAAEAGVAVVPIALSGTRSLLRGDTWFPRRGKATMVVEEALRAAGPGWSEALALRAATRAAILAHCGEPSTEGPLG
jgi:1-acyl-sn-glycerol-3-phosphate acyltransferase